MRTGLKRVLTAGALVVALGVPAAAWAATDDTPAPERNGASGAAAREGWGSPPDWALGECRELAASPEMQKWRKEHQAEMQQWHQDRAGDPGPRGSMGGMMWGRSGD